MLAALLLSALAVPAPQAANDGEPLRVFLRGGPKTHGEGEHDHPAFVREWTALLEARGAGVSGGLKFPEAAELEAADVLVMYAAEGGSIHADERARLDRFLARGGGLVVLHDAVCGDDPGWFQGIVGGAWEHGYSKWHEGEVGLCFADREHPITRGAANFDFEDEIYWDLHLEPEAHVLAHAFHTPFDVTPQMWTYERDDYRAFVSLQGHYARSFEHAAWRTLLLRGIAWAGKRDADLLLRAGEAEALRYPPGGPLAPEVAHEPFQLHPDFRIDLTAAEPLVENPISIDWDAQGRAWVACTPGYPYKQESSGIQAHDYIAILHDDDGDGRVDRAERFFEGLDLVTSLLPYRDGVIVTAAPHILWLRDLDGDDRADRAEVLYTGFGYGDTHATTSNLRWGMDGWVYATQGYSGGASRNVRGFVTEPRPVWSSPGGWGLGMGEARDGQPGGQRPDGVPFGHIPNGLFRFQPDGSRIETVASYGSNTWGLDFAPDGELFFTMANGAHLRHVVLPDSALDGQRLGRAPSWLNVPDYGRAYPISANERPPYQQIDFVGGFTAAAGSLIQDGGAWPADYRGDHFVCEPTINLVHRDLLVRDGLAFRASDRGAPEFLASTDLWFRPVHVRSAPDGAMVVLDFYNQAAVHNDTRGPKHGPTNAAVRPDRDAQHGRIWRVQHKAATPIPGATRLADLTASALLDELSSPNSWRRDTALRLLAEGAAEAIPLDQLLLFSHQAAEPSARLRAVHLIDRLGASDEEILAALEDPDPTVCWHAARILARRADDARAAGRSPGDVPEALLLLALDPNPRVLLEALIAMSRFDVSDGFATELAPDFAALYAELTDDWARSALIAIYAEHPVSLFEAACPPPGAGPLDGALAEATLHPIAAGGDATERASALARLSPRAPESPDDVAVLLAAFARALPAEADLAACAAPLADLLASESLGVAMAALPLAARLPAGGVDVEPLLARVLGVIADPAAPLPTRLGAVDALLAMPAEDVRARGVEAAGRFLDPYFALEDQLRVIDALGDAMARSLDAPVEVAAAGALVRAFRSLSHTARERAFHHLAQRAARLTPLFDALEREDLSPNDLGPARRHRLEHHPDAGVAARAKAVLATPVDANKEALIAALLPQVTARGDARNGALVFKENCANCHTFEGAGGKVGPDLTGMGAHGAAALLPFLIDPNREVDPSYVDYVAETFDGRLLTGVLVRETPREITLRSSTGEETVERVDLESLVSTGRSPMPEGFESLGAPALRDVLTYLGGGYDDFRIVDLGAHGTTTTQALYDAKRDAKPMRFRAVGVVDVGGVPFEIQAPARTARNALALKGGLAADWDSKLQFPQTVTVPVGFPLERMHVLGGIAAWGHPYTRSGDPAVRWTWVYADGERAEVVLHDGEVFADWIRRHEVPGSEWVDLLVEGSWGQVRHFTLDAPRRDVPVEAIELTSFDNHLSPTFLALTARVRGADGAEPVPSAWTPPAAARVAIFGGGSSHDFARWYGEADRALFEGVPGLSGKLHYEELPGRLAALLPQLDVLMLCNNQPLADAELRAGLFAHVDAGRGLLLAHAATWYNWPDWPEYNAELVGGGARGHEPYREFVVTVVDKDHPVTRGVRSSFGIQDELYRFEPDAQGAPIRVLATGTSPATGETYPVLWTVEREGARILSTTLGHDGAAHNTPEYRTLLRNAAEWLR